MPIFRIKKLWIVLLTMLGSCWLSLPCRGEDWPQWCGNEARNAVSGETNLPAEFLPNHPAPSATNAPTAARKSTNLKWKVQLNTHAYGGPVVANGKIFIGINDRQQGGVVMGLEEATGRELWRLTIPRLRTTWKLFNYDDLALGICSTPTVVDRRLYVVSNRDEMLCLDPDGRLHRRPLDLRRLTDTQGSGTIQARFRHFHLTHRRQRHPLRHDPALSLRHRHRG